MTKSVLIFFLCLFVVGCGYRDPAPKVIQDELSQKLSAVPMSEDLRVEGEYSADLCNAKEVLESKEESLDLRKISQIEVWNACKRLYACGPIAKQKIQSMFAENNSFQLGFTDLQALQIAPLGGQVKGIFLVHTNKIYLDYSLKSPQSACAILIHELTHRFDSRVSATASLETEYSAYWNQTAFEDEVYLKFVEIITKNPDTLKIENFYEPYFQTRKDLLQHLKPYGFSINENDEKIIENFDKLPRELNHEVEKEKAEQRAKEFQKEYARQREIDLQPVNPPKLLPDQSIQQDQAP